MLQRAEVEQEISKFCITILLRLGGSVWQDGQMQRVRVLTESFIGDGERGGSKSG